MRAKDACAAVAEKIQLSSEARAVRGRPCSDGKGGTIEPLEFDRRVRWTRQNAVLAGLIDSSVRGKWVATEHGAKTHLFSKPGVVVTVWQTDRGAVLWSEFRSAVQYIEQGSVTTCFTSPPFPLVRNREYTEGMPEWAPEAYLDTILDEIGRIRPLLARDGSMVLNLGPAFLPSKAARNPYMHQLIAKLVDNLGWSLVDEHFWFNPSKPRVGPQVTQWRTHCVNGMEQFFILSPTGSTKCSNWRVLNPYTPKQRALLERGGEVVVESQPSRVQSPGRRFHADNGGSIPFNFHKLTPDRDLAYRKACQTHGLPEHAAMMPAKLAEFFIELTSEPNDLVLDPFAGSLKTMAAALKLDRRCIVTERCIRHIQGGLFRLPGEVSGLVAV
jgi:site-specific DNA-methyltransferase (cytosine-N4-specific)